MSPTELIADAGLAMFGGQWKAGLARSLDVSERTINRWLGGRFEPRPSVFVDLLKVLRERRDEITRLIGEIETYVRAAEELASGGKEGE